MLKVKFFHTPKNKKFNYAPLYYNPEEEERKKREELKSGKAKPGESIRGRFTERRQKQKKSSRVSNTRAFIIIVVLLALAYYLIF
jgi:preprotein translocase subunit Sec63